MVLWRSNCKPPATPPKEKKCSVQLLKRKFRGSLERKQLAKLPLLPIFYTTAYLEGLKRAAHIHLLRVQRSEVKRSKWRILNATKFSLQPIGEKVNAGGEQLRTHQLLQQLGIPACTFMTHAQLAQLSFMCALTRARAPIYHPARSRARENTTPHTQNPLVGYPDLGYHPRLSQVILPRLPV